MQKRELLKLVSEKSGVDLKTVHLVFDTFSATVRDRLLFGIDIKISNFLNFIIKTSEPYERYDVLSGTKKMVPKRYRVIVSLPRSFKKKMNEKPVH